MNFLSIQDLAQRVVGKKNDDPALVERVIRAYFKLTARHLEQEGVQAIPRLGIFKRIEFDDPKGMKTREIHFIPALDFEKRIQVETMEEKDRVSAESPEAEKDDSKEIEGLEEDVKLRYADITHRETSPPTERKGESIPPSGKEIEKKQERVGEQAMSLSDSKPEKDFSVNKLEDSKEMPTSVNSSPEGPSEVKGEIDEKREERRSIYQKTRNIAIFASSAAAGIALSIYLASKLFINTPPEENFQAGLDGNREDTLFDKKAVEESLPPKAKPKKVIAFEWGDTLSEIASKEYKQAAYWPYIYFENDKTITHPERIVPIKDYIAIRYATNADLGELYYRLFEKYRFEKIFARKMLLSAYQWNRSLVTAKWKSLSSSERAWLGWP